VAEKGARPNVPRVQRLALRAVRAFSSPLLPDDYLELINPLWSTRELRGKIERVEQETETACTVVIKPSYRFDGHEPGQFLRIGIDIKGRRHWRAYSLTSDPENEEGIISITVKNVDEGAVSPYLTHKARVGTIVGLGGVEGDFTLPDEIPEKLLFISAGSGITPIMSMLRSLDHRDEMNDVVLIHSAKDEDDVIFGEQLRELEKKHDGFKLHEQHTGKMGRFEPAKHFDEICEDWKERVTFLSGPEGMLDAVEEHFDKHDLCDQLYMERFQPKLTGETGDGGKIIFTESDCEAVSDGETPIMVVGEEKGLDMPYGCREGVCHTCVLTLKSGKIRDLRNGKVSGEEGETIRTCINAPEGHIEIEF
jgi:stearoyl-CoA 9-desaturase NADPH oxidoreductase